MLPNVHIQISNGGLEQTAQEATGVCAMVVTGDSVNGKIQLEEPEQLFSLAQAIERGITPTGINAYAYTHVNNFYDEASEGAELWIMVVDQSVKMSEMADKNLEYAKKLVAAAKGRIRFLGISRKSEEGVTIVKGLDEDVDPAVRNAHVLGEYFASRFQPIRTVIDGKDFNGNQMDLFDYSTPEFNRSSITIVNSDGSKNAGIGIVLGKKAAHPVQRKIARVKSGALKIQNAYFTNGQPIETIEDSWNAIHAKNYIFMRYFPARSGYYFTYDPTCSTAEDDFNTLTNGFVIDEVIRIAYDTLLENLNDEVPAEADGSIAAGVVKFWEAQIDNALNAQLTVNGNISGAKAKIDPKQDNLSTQNVTVEIDVQPVGYAKNIIVKLGFTKTLDNL